MAKASIKLTKYTAEYNYDPDQRKGWSLLVRATDAVDMDREIFVYHRMSGTDAYTGDVFEAIASANQYFELPKNAPVIINDRESIPYYRRNQMEGYARTIQELEEIWNYVQIDVGRLVADLNSSKILASTTQAQVSGDGVIANYDVGSESVVLELNWEPAGSWDGKEIKNVDLNKPGWLPVSEFDNSIADPIDSIPKEAVWFYNKAKDKDFKIFYDRYIKTPYEANILELNGQELLFGEGGTYEVTKDTIFWLENKNYKIEEIQKNPWANDYIDGVPLSYIPTIRIIMPF